MFRMIKWIIFILVIVSAIYLWVFFTEMPKDDVEKIRKNLVQAVESGEISIVTDPLSEKIKADVFDKKSDFFKKLKQKIGRTLLDI